MKVISAYWFTDFRDGVMGIVVTEDEATGQRKAHIGRGEGIDQAHDTRMIVGMGAKLSRGVVVEILKELGEE